MGNTLSAAEGLSGLPPAEGSCTSEIGGRDIFPVFGGGLSAEGGSSGMGETWCKARISLFCTGGSVSKS